ncbi:hypothetical protein TMM008_15870 [Pseudomonas sp. 008]|nr:hypothetical protein TMM008_15870 [Pseudomonas sp. 008]
MARGLAPVGARSAPESSHRDFELESGDRFYDCFAVERGQAPSPPRQAPTRAAVFPTEVRPFAYDLTRGTAYAVVELSDPLVCNEPEP